VVTHHSTGDAVKGKGTPVIAQPFPEFQDISGRPLCKLLEISEPFSKIKILAGYAFYLRLLQHDL
jgi:hypothetical protein